MGDHGDHGHGGGGEKQQLQMLYRDDPKFSNTFGEMDKYAKKKSDNAKEVSDAKAVFEKYGQEIGAIRSLINKYKKSGKLDDKEILTLIGYRHDFETGKMSEGYHSLEDLVYKLEDGKMRGIGAKVLRMYRDTWKDAKDVIKKSSGTYDGQGQLYRIRDALLKNRNALKDQLAAVDESIGSMTPYLKK